MPDGQHSGKEIFIAHKKTPQGLARRVYLGNYRGGSDPFREELEILAGHDLKCI